MGYPEPLSEDEHRVVEAMRSGREFARYRRTILDIEKLLTEYDVAITAPLSDAILGILEERNEFKAEVETLRDANANLALAMRDMSEEIERLQQA